MSSLSELIQALHTEIWRFEPGVDLMARALYDAEVDALKTFVNGTHQGEPLTAC